jgi:RHS repeat-associated protein
VVDAVSYDGFGQVTAETNASAGDAYKYNGGRYDSLTGFTLFGAREYDAATGSWTTRDPSGFGGGDYNIYRYVGNGPTNQIDPTGLLGWSTRAAFGGLATGAVVGAGVGAAVGVWGFGITAVPAGGAGAIVGGVIGFVGGGVIVGETAPQASPTEQVAYGAVVGVPAGCVGGVLGPLGLSLASGAFWTSPVAQWLGVATVGGAGAQQVQNAGPGLQNAIAGAANLQQAAGITPQQQQTIADVLKGDLPRTALSNMTPEQIQGAATWYRNVAQANILTDADYVRQGVQAAFNNARADYLLMGGTPPGDFNSWVIRNFPWEFIRDNLPNVWKVHPLNVP